MELKSIKLDDYRAFPDRERTLMAWYESAQGAALFDSLQGELAELLSQRFGYLGVQVGAGGRGATLVELGRVRTCVLISSLALPGCVQAIPAALPLAAESADLVVLAHVLEHAPDPHQVLREAERVLVPEGDVVIVSFDPLSLWGLWTWFNGTVLHGNYAPWQGRFYSYFRVREWLNVLGFDLNAVRRLAILPPSGNSRFRHNIEWMERMGRRWCAPLGGVRIIMARKHRSGMILVRPAWKRSPAKAGVIAGNTSRSMSNDG